MRGWHTVLLSISLRCELVETKQELFFRSLTYRTRYVATYEAAARSTVQTCFEIASVKQAYEETHTSVLSRGDLASLWVKKTHDLGGDAADLDMPKNAFEFVDSAMKVYERMLSDDVLFGYIHSMEERYGKKSCWQHMSTLEAVVMKTRQHDEMEWILASIEDVLLRGECANTTFSSRSLKGARTGGGTRGLMDQMLRKKNILHYVLKELGSHGMPADQVTEVSNRMRSHKIVREAFGADADMSWLGGSQKPNGFWLTFSRRFSVANMIRRSRTH